MSIVRRIAWAGVALLIAAPAWAQVDTAQAQKKLLSKRAAEADAYRKIAECVRGLQITSDTYVKDFVAESDTIQAQMDAFIRGVRLGQPKWFEDLSCEVPAEVTVAKVIQELKEIHTRHYKGDRIKANDFEQMKQSIKEQVIKVVGMGAPREDLPADLPEGVAEQLGGPPTPPQPPIPPLWQQMGPQARMMAIRAGRVDAMRKLVERIQGLRITSDSLVRDFVAEYDTIQTVAQGTLVGATEKRVYLHYDEPIAEVTLSVPLESVITTIKELHARRIEGSKVTATDITEFQQRTKSQTFEATGTGIPPTKFIEKAESVLKVDFPDWTEKPIRAEGNGVPPEGKAGTPQGKLLAARAAEIDAKRKLAEQVFGLQISSDTLVKDFVAEHDEIRSSMDAVLVGSTVERTEFDGETAKVVVSLPGMEVWQLVYERLRVTRRTG